VTNQTEHHAEAILRAAGDDLSYYDGPARSAILDAVREAMAQERAAIVAWLRSPAFSYGDYSIAREANFLAYMIKRGEHLPQDTPQ